MKFLLQATCLFFTVSISLAQNNSVYPESKIVNEQDTFFGTIIKNPYAWLENQESDSVKNWVNKQNGYTFDYLKQVPYKLNLQIRLSKNTYYQSGALYKQGKYFVAPSIDDEFKTFDFYYKEDLYNDSWQELSVTKGIKTSSDENLSLRSYSLSNDSKYLAFSFSRNGSDWQEIMVVEIKSGKTLYDHLYNCKLTGIEWRENGFYYSRYDTIAGENKFTQKLSHQKLYYHTLGEDQSIDKLIFKRDDRPYNLFSVEVSPNNRFLILDDLDHIKNTHTYYYLDFNNKEITTPRPLAKNIKYYLSLMGSKGDTLLFENGSNRMSPVIGIDINNPKKWTAMIPPLSDAEFLTAQFHKGNFYVIASQDAEEKLIIFDINGKIQHIKAFPFGSNYSFSGVDYQRDKIYLSYSSFLHPPVLLSVDINSYQLNVVYQAKVNYESQEYEITKTYYKSDTANIPMLLMHKKGIKPDGTNPVLMEFYGGFGHRYQASFDPGKIMFIENGGIYAFPLIRGGGELGVRWHEAGKLFNKKNSINDIANAARYLFASNYSNPSKMAISGGSQGGLMAAAVAIKYPELFKVCVPVVGVHDMLKAENYTVGPLHIDEFGTVKDSLQFLNLLSYSPLHNIKQNVKYPAMLIMTSDHDDRVPPLHSYKFAAALQQTTNQNILLRVEKNAGHNGAIGYDKSIVEMVDFYSFIFYNLGIEKLKN